MAGIFIFVSGAMVALVLATMRSQEIDTSQRALDALTRVIEEQTTRSLQAVDGRLRLAADDLHHLAQDGHLDASSTREILLRHLRELPFARSMWVLDAQGGFLAGSTGPRPGSDRTDRDYFQAFAAEPTGRLFIGNPAQGEVTKQWRIPAAVGLRDANGKFLGVVAMGIDPAYFSASWASVDLGPNYAISLFRRDATLMMRSPLEPVELGRAFPQVAVFNAPFAGMATGRFRKVSLMDGQDRYFAFRSLALRPELLLVVGQSSAVVLAPWWRVAALATVIWLLASAAVAALSLYLQRARQKHAESEQRASDLGERLDIATSAAAMGAWDWDLRTDTVTASSGYYTMLGYPPTDLPVDRSAWLERCHPDDLVAASTRIRQALDGQVDNYEYEVRLRHANGDYRWTRLRGRVVQRDAAGLPVRMLGVRMDIHDHRLVQDALRRSEAFNTAVLDSVTAHIAVLDRDGVIVAVNQPWRQFAKDNDYAADSAAFPSQIGINYLGMSRAVPAKATATATAPEDPLASRAHAGICAVMAGRLPQFVLEYPCHVPQSERWFMMVCTPLEGAEGGVVVSHTEITERIAADNKVRQVMRVHALRGQISRAIVKNRNHQSLWQAVCRAAVEFGWFRMAWIGTEGASTGQIQPVARAGHEDGFLASLSDQADGGIDAAVLPRPGADLVTTTDITLDHPLAAWREAALQRGYHASATVLFTVDGKAFGSLHLFSGEAGFFNAAECETLSHIGRDLSVAFAAIDSEIARKTAELSLHGLLRDKEALLKEVHHRVKNNLQVVSSLLRLESSRDVAPATRSVLRDMQGRIQAMALLHENLYSSGNFGRVDLAVYVRQLSTQAFTTYSSGTSAVRLRLDLTPVDVSMDQAVTCGLLVNELLSNGLKHGFPDGMQGEVTIALLPQAGTGHMLLRVGDNGVGLPADFALRQTESLGLQLATDLAGQLGGSLQVGPPPSAVFTVVFDAHVAG